MRVGLLAARMDILGGVENVMLRTARHLRDTGRVPVVVTTALHSELQRVFATEGIATRVLEAPHETSRVACLESVARRAREALADCDVINVHNFPAHVWLYLCRDVVASRRVIFSCHEPPRALYEAVMDPVFLSSRFNHRPWYTRAWDHAMGRRWRVHDQAATRWVPLILTNSQYVAGRIAAIYGRQAVACYFGPSLPRGEDGLEGASAGPHRGFRILYAGRLTPMKNLETAIEALALLPAEVGACLRVVGDGDQRPRLEALARARGVAGQVTFLGTVEEQILEAEYAAADVALYIPFDEPMGLVPMESALRGVPAVVSSHAGPAEIVVHGETGWHVDALRPDDVAAGLLHLARDPTLRIRLGRAAAARVGSSMTFAHYARVLDAALDGMPLPDMAPPLPSRDAAATPPPSQERPCASP